MLSKAENFPPREGLELVGGMTLLPPSIVANWPRQASGLYDKPLRLGKLPFVVMISPSGFVADAIRALGLDKRQIRIRQLQHLTPMYLDEDTQPVPGLHLFLDSRLAPHTIGVVALTGLLCWKLGMSEQETKVAILRALAHDAETPAGGDSMKAVHKRFVDTSAFDEDANCANAFSRHPDRFAKLVAEHGLPKDTVEIVTRAVQGYGLDGQLHKIADTLSYVSTDLAQLERMHRRFQLPLYPHHERIRELERSEVFNLWQDVDVVDGCAVITDHELARQFIELHLELWVWFYTHPGHKGLETLMTQVVYPWLFATGRISPAQLLTWHDGDLYAEVQRVFSTPDLGRSLGALGQWPRRFVFGDRAEALRWQRFHSAAGHLAILGNQSHPPIAASRARKFHVFKDGKAMRYAEAYPDITKRLESRAEQVFASGGSNLYVFPKPILTSELKKAYQLYESLLHCS